MTVWFTFQIAEGNPDEEKIGAFGVGTNVCILLICPLRLTLCS